MIANSIRYSVFIFSQFRIVFDIRYSVISENRIIFGICIQSKKVSVTGMRVAVQDRAGKANKILARSEPLKRQKYDREDCFICTTGKGNCEKNCVGYEVKCETCHLDGRKTFL